MSHHHLPTPTPKNCPAYLSFSIHIRAKELLRTTYYHFISTIYSITTVINRCKQIVVLTFLINIGAFKCPAANLFLQYRLTICSPFHRKTIIRKFRHINTIEASDKHILLAIFFIIELVDTIGTEIICYQQWFSI